jgi:hypothetical protein
MYGGVSLRVCAIRLSATKKPLKRIRESAHWLHIVSLCESVSSWASRPWKMEMRSIQNRVTRQRNCNASLKDEQPPATT